MDLAILGIPVLNNVYFAEDSQSDAPLQPIVIPGRCWRFSGFPGTLVIRLAENVDITSVALSHIMGATVPRHRLISAPREFEVRKCGSRSGKSIYCFEIEEKIGSWDYMVL